MSIAIESIGRRSNLQGSDKRKYFKPVPVVAPQKKAAVVVAPVTGKSQSAVNLENRQEVEKKAPEAMKPRKSLSSLLR